MIRGEMVRQSATRFSIGATVSVALFACGVNALGVSHFIEFMNGVTVFSAVMLLGIYQPLWWPAIKGERGGPYRLGLGVAFVAASVVISRTWSNVWRIYGSPDWMVNHWMVAVGPALGVVAAALLITVPENVDGTVRTRGWFLIVSSIASGALISGFVLGLTYSDYLR